MGEKWQECLEREKEERIKVRERWWGRGRIKKESGDDVTMQLTPPAPALHWGWLSARTNPHEGDYYTHTCFHTGNTLELSLVEDFRISSKCLTVVIHHLCAFSAEIAHNILGLAWHKGWTVGESVLIAQHTFSQDAHQTENIIIHHPYSFCGIWKQCVVNRKSKHCLILISFYLCVSEATVVFAVEKTWLVGLI